MERFLTSPGTFERAQEHAERLAARLEDAGIRNVKVWGKPGVGVRVYLPNNQYVSVGRDGSIQTTFRGSQTFTPSALYPNQRTAYRKAVQEHLEWHQAAMDAEWAEMESFED